MEVWAIVVAAGSGSRFGGPKQFEVLDGKPMLEWAVLAAAQAADGVVLVAPRHEGRTAVDKVVAGGERRSDSVRAGLASVPEAADVIVVHDAARPFARTELFEAVIAAVRGGADGAVPAVPIADTVKRVAGSRVVETLDRSALVAVQTPQAFAADALRRAHAGQSDATDDAALVEAAGGKVVVVEGDRGNFKVTTPRDFEYAAFLLERTHRP